MGAIWVSFMAISNEWHRELVNNRVSSRVFMVVTEVGGCSMSIEQPPAFIGLL